MKFVNIFRGVFTTILGGLVMIPISIYCYLFADERFALDFHEAIWIFIAGIVLLLMPDDIPSFVRAIFQKWIGKKDATQAQGEDGNKN